MKLYRSFLLLNLGLALFSCHDPARNSNQSAVKEKVNLVSDHVRIDYTDTGTGDTTLLFVHGWCINKTYWADQLPHFEKRYRVVTIDLPGYGMSGKNRKVWNTAAFGRDIKNVITQLNLKNVVLIGHSMAGDIVLQGALSAPNKVIAIVGVDNFKSAGVDFKGDTVKAKKEYESAIMAMKKDFKKLAFAWFKQDLFSKSTSQAIKDRVLNDVAHTDPNIAIACQEPDSFSETAALLKYKKTLYLINSDYQPTDTTGMIAKHIPYKLFTVHNTGHFPMVEKPAEFNEQLDRVMATIKRR
jgi:pimeloyl-ACP methyl ester carboxylesterase